jgi:hypothetical protein
MKAGSPQLKPSNLLCMNPEEHFCGDLTTNESEI